MLTMGSGSEGAERQPRADAPHEDQRADGEDDRVRGVHDGRAEQHADGVEVVGGAGHDVAGPSALVVGVGRAFEVSEKSLRRSNSISRETPIMTQRVRNWKMPLPAAP